MRGTTRQESERFVDLRWAVAVVVALILIGTSAVVAYPWQHVVGLLALFVASNIALKFALWRGLRLGPASTGGILLFDLVLITAGLWFTGGPMNPFSFLYVVYVAMGATVTRGFLPWGLAAVAILGYGLLYFGDSGAQHHHHGDMRLHLEGMWMAMALTTLMTVGFMQVLQRALAASEASLREAQEQQRREEHLTALTTLAAGAAHELTTPLSTIALVSRDLAARLEGDDAEDAAVIRAQVERCKTILRSMANRAGRSVGESSTRFELNAMVEEIAGGFEGDVVLEPSDEVDVRAPRQALTESIRSLVQNGVDAGGVVRIRVGVRDELAFIDVRDDGSGIDPAIVDRVMDPFFSTKDRDGRMGLGLFVAKRLAIELGGDLRIESDDSGTRATFSLERVTA